VHLYAGSTTDCADPSRFPTFNTGNLSGAVDILIAVRRREIRHSMTASASIRGEVGMAKGQQKSNREAKKPKKEKIKTIAATPSQKDRGMAAGHWVREKDIMRSVSSGA
jgi:hypothetical protein